MYPVSKRGYKWVSVMKGGEKAATLLISFLNPKDEDLKKPGWMLRVCKLLCTVTRPHESNKALVGNLKWPVSLSAFYIVKAIFHNTKMLLGRKLPGAREFLYQNVSTRNAQTVKEKRRDADLCAGSLVCPRLL